MADARPALFHKLNTIEDAANPTDLEKKHTPVITAPDSVKAGECFEVTVEVGKLLAHPNELAHSIEYIDLWAGHTYLTRLDLFIMLSTVMVFTTLVEVVVTASLAKTGRVELAQKIDRRARIAYPAAFVLIAIVSLAL